MLMTPDGLALNLEWSWLVICAACLGAAALLLASRMQRGPPERHPWMILGPAHGPLDFHSTIRASLQSIPVVKGTDWQPQLHRVGAMERFVRRQNVEHYMQLLTTITEGAQRQKIMKLLSEERQKQKDAGDSNERILMLIPQRTHLKSK
jgi:hypothetical protein